MATNLFDLYAKISLDDSEFNSGIDKALTQGTGFASKIGTAFTGISNVGKKAFKAVGVAVTAGGVALGAFVKSSVDTGMTFDKSMSQVAATMGLSMDEINTQGSEANKTFQALREAAIHYGETTAFTSTQASEALNYMALAGYDAETAISTLPAVLNLAAAGGLDLGYASDMITDSQTALGLSLEETNVLMDQMAMTASRSNTSVGQLGEAILTVGGTAKYMSGGTEELSSVIGVLADNGIKGSEAGTHLRNIILKLASPTDAGAAALDRLGVSIFDSEGKMRSFSEIFPELNAAMSNLTEEEKLQALSDIFNVRDIASANALLGTTSQRWDELGGYIENAGGSMAQMAATQLDNLAGDVTILNSAMDGLKIAISDKVTPSLRKFAQQGTQYVGRVKKALTDTGWRGALTEVSKILAEMIAQFISYLPQIADVAVQMISSFIDAISSNSGSIIQAGGMILDAIVSGLSQIREKVMPVISQFVPLVADYFMTYKGQMFSIGLDIITAIVQGIGDNMASIGQSAGDMLTTILTSIQENLPTLITAGLNIINGLYDYITQNLSILMGQGSAIISQIVDSITTAIPGLIIVATYILSNLADYIITNIPTLLVMGGDLINQVITTITESLPLLASSATDILTKISDLLIENLPGILLVGTYVINQIITTISESLPTLVTAATDILTNISNFLIENLPSLLTIGIDVINQIITTITESLPELATIATDILTNIVDFIVENLPGILTMGADLISQVVTTISESLPNLATSAVEILQQIVSSITENLPDILDIGLSIINQLISTITDNLPDLLQSGIDMLNQILQGFMDTLPDLVAEIPGMIIEIVTSIGENLPSMIAAGGEILSSILDGFAELFSDIPGVISDLWDSFSKAVKDIDWIELGKNIINGVIEGLEGLLGTVVESAKNIFGSIVDGVKDFLGIHSPSTVFSDIGENMVAGVESGWNGDIGTTQESITNDLDFSNDVNGYVNTFKEGASQMAHYAMLSEKSIKTTFNELSTTLGNTITAIKTNIVTKWGEIQNNSNTKWNSIKTTIQNAANNINTSVSTAFGNMRNSISNNLNSISNAIGSTFRNAVNTVNNAVNSMRNAMNFNWSLPYLKLPHVSIRGWFSLNPPSAPTFSVSWYRKAMNNPMLLNNATIFGAMGGKLLGGGEAGQEVVSGANTLMGMIRDAVRDGGTKIGTININIDGAKYDDADELADVIAEKLQNIVDRRAAAWA